MRIHRVGVVENAVRGEMNYFVLACVALDFLFARARAEENFACASAVKLSERFDFRFGFGQGRKVFIAVGDFDALDDFLAERRIAERR